LLETTEQIALKDEVNPLPLTPHFSQSFIRDIRGPMVWPSRFNSSTPPHDIAELSVARRVHKMHRPCNTISSMLLFQQHKGFQKSTEEITGEKCRLIFQYSGLSALRSSHE